MAKIIKMTPELKEECRKAFQEEFERALTTAKLTDGKLNFTKTFGTVNRKASVYFTEIAWMKMTSLLREFSKEVAWHATAYRIPGDGDDYLIKDILVYPQTVSAATVEMDTEKYAKWLMENYEDSRFDNIRSQMHSHVNMGVTPSSVDLTHQEEILAQLGDDDFYIFMIWNKSLNVNIRIFDMQKNVLFETSDVTWGVVEGEIGLQKFIDEAKKMVEDRVYTPPAYANQGYGRSPYYNPQYYGPYDPVGHQSGHPATGGNLPPAGNNGGNGKKDKKKDKKKTKFAAGANACEERVVRQDGSKFDMSDPFGYCDGPFQIT